MATDRMIGMGQSRHAKEVRVGIGAAGTLIVYGSICGRRILVIFIGANCTVKAGLVRNRSVLACCNQAHLENDCLNNEKDILARVAKGDQKAFELLIDEYSTTIYKHVLTYLKNAARAEEITQDIFMTIWSHRVDLPAIENFPGYLFVITRNRTHSAFREKLMRTDEPKDELESTWLDPAHALEYRQLSEVLKSGIDLLPPRRKEVFTMSRFEGKTYDEIGGILGLSKSAVNKHIIEALLFLRTYLANRMSLLFLAWSITAMKLGGCV